MVFNLHPRFTTVYYSAVISAEVFGKTNTSQIIDLLGNNASDHTPYVVLRSE
jgi:hypothetical protein